MTPSLDEFFVSLDYESPDPQWSEVITALWYDKSGNWDKAHDCVQDGNSREEAWVHAYLHRKEGDIWNADYWYRRAGRSRPDVSLDEEWNDIVSALTDRSD